MTPEVEDILKRYELAGMPRLTAIRQAIQDEKIERDKNGNLREIPLSRKPGRRLLGV